MKLLITGDIHGQYDVLEKVLKKEKHFDLHLNTGDLGLDIETINKLGMIAVKGNTDYDLNLPTERLIEHQGLRILLTHGHLQNVKYGLNELIVMAEEMQANICIFGHTHDAFYRQINHVTFINPGALSGHYAKTYAIYEEKKVSIIHVD